MERRIFLTEKGMTKLKSEHEDLTTRMRKEIAKKIRDAKEYGDLSENAEYVDAKEQQGFIEGRIAELEHVIKNASIIKHSKKKSDIVEVGSLVHVEIKGGKLKYTIVGAQEADPDKGLISHESPIGQALLGKKKGETIAVTVPSGTVKYKISNIE